MYLIQLFAFLIRVDMTVVFGTLLKRWFRSHIVNTPKSTDVSVGCRQMATRIRRGVEEDEVLSGSCLHEPVRGPGDDEECSGSWRHEPVRGSPWLRFSKPPYYHIFTFTHYHIIPLSLPLLIPTYYHSSTKAGNA